MSRGHPRLTVRLEPELLESVNAKARATGVSGSSILRTSLAVFTRDVGDDGVMIRLTPYYREQLVKRLRDYPGQEPSAILERFMQLALDGAWLMTDREA
jgi:hypothetical protein